jgi:N-acetylmuramoyl-L-alanine amidase
MHWARLGVLLVLLSVTAAGAAFPTVQHEGQPYVELDRIAASLRTRLDATPSSVRAYLRIPGHVVTLTRNWAEIAVDGKAMTLEAPVRVRDGAWIVPESFVASVLPMIGAAAPPPASGRARAAAAVGLTELRFRSYPTFTRVVLETTGGLTYRVEPAASKEIRVAIPALAAEPRAEEVGDGLVAGVRLERAGGGVVVRVLFEGQAIEPKTAILTDPHRLVLDFPRPAEEDTRARGEQAAPLRLVVLDAGHGGHDSGAVGPSGLMEKDLVLDVTRRVARLAEQELKIRVLLTRDGDHFVTLRDRTSFANRERADLFVSIHANAHPQAVSEGVETYFLSSEASDSAARQAALVENSVVQLEKPAARGKPDILRAMLWDLAQSTFQLESSRLAEVVLDSMTRSLRIPNRGVKQAGFYVLGGAAMPAVLIEIGFVTNHREERRLRESRYRDEIARAILAGLAEYKRHWDLRVRAVSDRSR